MTEMTGVKPKQPVFYISEHDLRHIIEYRLSPAISENLRTGRLTDIKDFEDVINQIPAKFIKSEDGVKYYMISKIVEIIQTYRSHKLLPLCNKALESAITGLYIYRKAK